jgi:hypothetical protein
MSAHHVPLKQIVTEIRRDTCRRELNKRGRGVKDHIDKLSHKSIGIVTLIAEVLAKINPCGNVYPQ